MTVTTLHADRGRTDEVVGASSRRLVSKPGTRAKVLFTIAVALLALSLGLEERVTSRILASPRVSVADDRNLEDVRSMLRLADASRNERIDQR